MYTCCYLMTGWLTLIPGVNEISAARKVLGELGTSATAERSSNVLQYFKK